MYLRRLLSGLLGLVTLFQVSSARATCARFCEDALVAADCTPLDASPTIAANEPLRFAGTCEVQCNAGPGTGTRTPDPFTETYRAWQGELFENTMQEVAVTTADGPRCGERAVRVVTPTAGVWRAGKHGASAQGGRAHPFSVAAAAADDAGEGAAGCSASGHGESRGLFGLVAAVALGTLVVARRRRSRCT